MFRKLIMIWQFVKTLWPVLICPQTHVRVILHCTQVRARLVTFTGEEKFISRAQERQPTKTCATAVSQTITCSCSFPKEWPTNMLLYLALSLAYGRITEEE
jgi:hypothetical protein